MIIIESDDNGSDNDSDSNNNNNNNSDNDENNDNDNKLWVDSPHKGPIMLSFDVTLVESKTTVEFPVIWDAMSLT